MKTKKKNTLLLISIVLLLLLFLSLVSCKNEILESPAIQQDQEMKDEEVDGEIPSESRIETEEDVTQGPNQEDILSEFYRLFEQEAKPFILAKYVDENIGLMPENTIEEMLQVLEKSQKVYKDIYMNILFEENFQETLFRTYTSDEELMDTDRISDTNLKDILNEIFDGGYKLISLEGSFYPFIDYAFYEKYYQYISHEFIDYYDIMAAESNDIYARDAALTISWEQLSKRLIDSENYLMKYPTENIRKIEVSQLYMNYLSAYFYGMNNTPSRDYTTNMVLDEVILSYQKIAQQYPETVTGTILIDYLELLKDKNYILAGDLFDVINNYFRETIKTYNLDSSNMLIDQIKNLHYPLEFSEAGYIKLTEGKYLEKYGEDSESELTVSLSDYIAVGDLDGDQINDAAAIIVSDPGGSGTFYTLYMVLNGYFYLYSFADDFLGDRIKIESLSIEGQKAYIDMVIHKEDDPLCCPTNKVSRAYLIQDNQLIKLISHTGILNALTEDHFEIILDDNSALTIMLEGYELPSGITEGSKVYIEYYTDYIAEQNILYFIKSM